MIISDYTKGKWEAVWSGIDQLDVLSPEGKHICVLFGFSASRKKEQEANARLIAKAPEMYELLKTCADHFNHIGFSPMGEMCEELIASIDGKEDGHEE